MALNPIEIIIILQGRMETGKKLLGDNNIIERLGHGRGGVWCTGREPGERWVAEAGQPCLFYSCYAGTEGMGDAGRELGGGGCPCLGNPLAAGVREERWMKRRTKTSQQFEEVVSSSRQYIITSRSAGGVDGARHRSSTYRVVEGKFRRPRGHHIHYANVFRHYHNNRCQDKFLNCDTIISDVSSSDARVKQTNQVVDNFRRLHHRLTSRNKTTKGKNVSNRKLPGSNFNHRILLHVILFFLNLNQFSTSAHAAPHPSSSSSSSSSSTDNRYHLLPPPSNSSVLIHFNPPSITDLQINKPQRVFFNFTVYHRPWKQQKQPQQPQRPLTSIQNNSNSNNTTYKSNDDKNTYKSHRDISKDIGTVNKVEVALSDSTATTAATVQTTNTFLSKNGSGGSSSGFSVQHLDISGTINTTPLSALTPSYPSLTIPRPDSPDSSSRNHSTSSFALANDAPGTSQQGHHHQKYLVMIYSNDANVARLRLSKHARNQQAYFQDDDSKEKSYTYFLMTVTPGRQYNFSVEAKHIGRTTMSLAVVDAGGLIIPLPKPSYVQAVASSQYEVAAVRGERTADVVFNSAAAAIAVLISFGMGASTDVESLKRQLKFPVSLIVGFCCQFIIMPVLAFGVAMALPIDKDIQFGLLCVACVPGGGLGHIAVIIAGGDTALSMTINLINVVASLGIAPLWIFVLGQYFQTESDAALTPRMLPIFNFEIWLVASFLAYMAGLIIKRFRAPVADAILMWLIKPFLLLASILYITIGVYINMYVFELVNEYALLGAVILPFSGFLLGAGLAYLCRQGNSFIKTIALETASLNCVVVLVALRFSLPQPDADLASMIPIWVLFTTPGLFVVLSIIKKVKNTALHYWRNRNNNKKDAELLGSTKAYSVSSSAVSPPGTTTLSAPLVVADGVDDDLTISTTSNQKVTVL